MRHSIHVEDGLKTELEAVKSDLSNLRTDLRGLADAVLRQGKDSAATLRQDATDRVEAGARAIEKCVTQRPWTSLIAMFGIGFIAAKVWRSR